MKNTLLIIRWIVGLLFIFSGLVKINDPLGLSFKMQEFFEVWGIPFFNNFSLGLSIMMNVLEVGCGIGLLLGFRMSLISRILLVLIVFFTFLTGYALLSGKIKTCGCLGDCLPLTPAMSFAKDLVLLVLIVVLFVYNKDIKPYFNRFVTNAILMLSLVASIFAQDIVLNYLPFVDCLPFKAGNNIVEQMQKPKNYVPDSTVITYQYKKNGKTIEFDQSHFPADFDSTYEYINRFDKLIRKGTGEAKITDFALQTASGNDTTQALFATPKYVLMIGNTFPSNFDKWLLSLTQIKNYCSANHLPFFYVTSQGEDEIKRLEKENVTVLRCDVTTVKTAARTNSTIFLMNNATIFKKISSQDLNKVLNGLEMLKRL
ncbi:BT_3928 family protein [Parasediminibacterium sp. JCM 36343]|uniref:BT_3928 family protein n=1 Tax=Parasediminibacterium sp. JCM 36343 TaxID=3374279 RepID=UPI00397C9546